MIQPLFPREYIVLTISRIAAEMFASGVLQSELESSSVLEFLPFPKELGYDISRSFFFPSQENSKPP